MFNGNLNFALSVAPEIFTTEFSGQFMFKRHVSLGLGQHLDKLDKVDAPVHVAVGLLHHVGDLLLSKSFPKVQHAYPELIL